MLNLSRLFYQSLVRIKTYMYVCGINKSFSMKNLKLESGILAVGLVLLGLFLYFGLGNVMIKDRIVSVRGLAEREVQADHVIWPLVYETTSDNLQEAMSDINRGNNKIRQWLIKHGVKPADISMGAPQIRDRATQYDGDYRGLRYKASCTTTVSTRDVALVRQLIPQLGQLVEMGVAISAEDYDSQVQYEFTSLNKIKPQMIEEATKNARTAGEKFARDSDSKLGKIKDATQGLFDISDRDDATPYIKKVRVVTSIDYYLTE